MKIPLLTYDKDVQAAAQRVVDQMQGPRGWETRKRMIEEGERKASQRALPKKDRPKELERTWLHYKESWVHFCPHCTGRIRILD